MKPISGDALLRVLSGEEPPGPRLRVLVIVALVVLALAWSVWLGCALRAAQPAPWGLEAPAPKR